MNEWLGTVRGKTWLFVEGVGRALQPGGQRLNLSPSRQRVVDATLSDFGDSAASCFGVWLQLHANTSHRVHVRLTIRHNVHYSLRIKQVQ